MYRNAEQTIQLLTLSYQIQVSHSATELYVQFLHNDVDVCHARKHRFCRPVALTDGSRQGLVPVKLCLALYEIIPHSRTYPNLKVCNCLTIIIEGL